jgi:hypothetical protein
VGIANINQVQNRQLISQRLNALSEFLNSGCAQLDSRDIAQIVTKLLIEET